MLGSLLNGRLSPPGLRLPVKWDLRKQDTEPVGAAASALNLPSLCAYAVHRLIGTSEKEGVRSKAHGHVPLPNMWQNLPHPGEVHYSQLFPLQGASVQVFAD